MVVPQAVDWVVGIIIHLLVPRVSCCIRVDHGLRLVSTSIPNSRRNNRESITAVWIILIICARVWYPLFLKNSFIIPIFGNYRIIKSMWKYIENLSLWNSFLCVWNLVCFIFFTSFTAFAYSPVLGPNIVFSENGVCFMCFFCVYTLAVLPLCFLISHPGLELLTWRVPWQFRWLAGQRHRSEKLKPRDSPILARANDSIACFFQL